MYLCSCSIALGNQQTNFLYMHATHNIIYYTLHYTPSVMHFSALVIKCAGICVRSHKKWVRNNHSDPIGPILHVCACMRPTIDMYMYTLIISIQCTWMLKVLSECPELKGHERDIDKVLKDCLIQSKHYKSKKDRAAKVLNSVCICYMYMYYNFYFDITSIITVKVHADKGTQVS